MKRTVLIILVLAFFVSFIPSAFAVDPVKNCEYASGFTSFDQDFFGQSGSGKSFVDTYPTGEVVYAISGFDSGTGARRAGIDVLNTDCILQWNDFFGNAPGDSNDAKGFSYSAIYDGFGRAIWGNKFTDSTPSSITNLLIQLRQGSTGGILATSTDFSDLSPAWIELDSIDSARISSSAVKYLGISSTVGKIAKVSQNLQTNDWIVSVPSIVNLRGNGSTEFFTVISGGATNTYEKRALSDGSQIDSITRGGCFFSATSCLQPPVKGQTGNDHMFVLHQTTTTSRALSYSTIRTSTMDILTNNQGFTPSQIEIGGTPYGTDAWYFDVDGADNLLVCGEVAQAGNTVSFVAKYDTDTNTQDWQIVEDFTPTSVSNDESARFCKFDHVGGFYVGYQYKTGANSFSTEIHHYTGGGFVAPADEAGGTITGGGSTGGTGPAANTDNPLGQVIQVASDTWGFDWAPIFGLIIVGVVLVRVKNKSVIVLGTIALIMMYIVVKLGLFPDWILYVIVLFILLTGAFLLGRGRTEDE